MLVLLLTCEELLVSAPKIKILLTYPPLECEKLPFESNPIPYPDYLYLLISTFFYLTAPNRQFSKVTLLVLTKGFNL